MPKDKLIVIGGTGFIGHHLVKKAKFLGWDVSSLSLNKPQKNRIIEGVKYITSEYFDESLVKKVFSTSYQYVVNLSGYIDHSNFSQGGKETIISHFDNVRKIVEFIDKDSLKCFVNIGSSDEYGPNLSPQVETQREYPISPYSFGKTATTHFLEMINRTENFPSCTLRLFLVYGPGQNEERFIPQIIKGCLLNENIKTSKGDQIRDFCYVDDIVEGIIKTINSKLVYGNTYNLASGFPIKINKIINKLRKIIKKGTPLFGEIPYRNGENMELYANIKKIQKDIDWVPQTSLDEGLIKTVEWYQEKWKDL